MTSDEHLNPLEAKALQEALKGPEPWKRALREQVSALRVTGREDTVVGGYTNFALDGEYPRAIRTDDKKGYPVAVDVEHPQLPYGGAFLVWLKEGLISFLEYYAGGGENWPKHAGLDSFTFLHRPKRKPVKTRDANDQ